MKFGRRFSATLGTKHARSPLPEHYPAIFALSKAKPTTRSCEQLFRENAGTPGDIQAGIASVMGCGREEVLGEARCCVPL